MTCERAKRQPRMVMDWMGLCQSAVGDCGVTMSSWLMACRVVSLQCKQMSQLGVPHPGEAPQVRQHFRCGIEGMYVTPIRTHTENSRTTTW